MTASVYALYDSLIAKKILVRKSVRSSKGKIASIKREISAHEKARTVFTEVSKLTQQETKERIENLVTLAIQSVFEDRDFSFKMRFESKNNRVYAYPIIEEYGQELDPKEDMGGGIIDVISIALKIILWHMENPRKRNVLLLDEPFRFTGKLITKTGQMLKFLSTNLGIQVIMVSHDDELIAICDQVYKVTRIGNKSITSLIKKYERKIRRRNG